MRAVIFIGSGKISYGKLAQALDHGALTVQIAGDFDDAMQRVSKWPASWASTWSTASIPSGSKGRRRSCTASSKALRWEVPDWIVVPGGNLGNVQRFGKAFHRVDGAGPDRRGCRGWPSSTPPAPTRCISSTSAAACAGTAASPTIDKIDGYIPASSTPEQDPGFDHRQRHRDQSAGQPAQGLRALDAAAAWCAR
jgi:hypothetical protein